MISCYQLENKIGTSFTICISAESRNKVVYFYDFFRVTELALIPTEVGALSFPGSLEVTGDYPLEIQS